MLSWDKLGWRRPGWLSLAFKGDCGDACLSWLCLFHASETQKEHYKSHPPSLLREWQQRLSKCLCTAPEGSFTSLKGCWLFCLPGISCPRTVCHLSEEPHRVPLGLNLADVQGCLASSSNSKEQAPMLKSELPYRDWKCSYPEFWLGPTFCCTHCLDNFAKHWAHPAGW